MYYCSANQKYASVLGHFIAALMQMARNPQNIVWQLESVDILDCTVDIFECSGW